MKGIDLTNEVVWTEKHLASLDPSEAEHIIIPEGFTAIDLPSKFFRKEIPNEKIVKKITLPKSLRIIASIAICPNVEEIEMQEGIKIIGYINCKKVEKFILPESVESVGSLSLGIKTIKLNSKIKELCSTFSGCYNLKEIIIPDNVEIIEAYTFHSCRKLSSVKLNDKIKVIGSSSFANCDMLKELILPSRLEEIGTHAFYGAGLEDITIPGTVKVISEGAFEGCNNLKEVTIEEGVEEIGKEAFINTKIKKIMIPNSVVKIDPTAFEKGTQIKRANESESKNTQDSIDTCADIEAFCRANFDEKKLNNSIKKAGLSNEMFEGVLYKGGKALAPAFVVKCAVIPYIDLMETRPKKIGEYKTDYLYAPICEDVDKIAAKLDKKSFIKALEEIADIPEAYHNPQCLIPLCRYGTGEHVKAISAEMNKWQNWYQYSSKGRSAIIVARGAILLNDSREAMIFADKNKCLKFYAKMRNMDEDSFRNKKLSDFGLDKEGKKTWELGNKTISVTINKDLSLSLFDNEAAKTVKSIPKRGADPVKYELAHKEYSDLKKNLKTVVKGQNNALFEMFLNGNTKPAKSWKSSYLDNPVLHRVAELIVWNQEEKTFILSEDGIIDCHGNPYDINDNIPIGVAHSIMMSKEDLKLWQKYFTTNNLKQPFEQVWEAAINPKEIKADRYKNCMIPFYRFVGQEKNGITVKDKDFHSVIEISFYNCHADVVRIDRRRHDIRMNDNFEIKSFNVPVEYSRRANHIVAYLDKITILGRILKDDTSIVEYLPQFTLAQITEFTKLAIENKCVGVVAVLMEYKNKAFEEFDPMEEFVL
jgi:hypothetical protein